MINKLNTITTLLFAFCSVTCFSQAKISDVATPLHALKVTYPVPYEAPTTGTVKNVLNRVYTYLDAVTPPQFIHKKTNAVVSPSAADTNVIFKPGDFRLTSYEWGVTYSGMLAAGKATGDPKFTNYTKTRLEFLANAAPSFRALLQQAPSKSNPLRQMLDPHALDDAGAMAAAAIKLLRSGGQPALRPMVDNYLDYVSNKEYRLPDGTLARNRPQKNTLWLDDLYMSIPALAQMGKLTGDSKYFDDAVKQVMQFSQRMYNKEKGVYMHGWVEGMDVHPQFHWARANGWAFMAMTELLDVLPETHPGRTAVLEQYKALAKGLVAYQSDKGFWHQLLDRNDSYLETSATAIYAYCLARGINQGWLDAMAYGPATVLAWNAVSTKVNTKGQVEGTCVGTGMAFDPAFYYYRPTSVFAAHGYGPVLLAGAEVINLLNQYSFEINDSALQLKKK
jgi:unsaturated rhamnogalacturonyl hydrolase